MRKGGCYFCKGPHRAKGCPELGGTTEGIQVGSGSMDSMPEMLLDLVES